MLTLSSEGVLTGRVRGLEALPALPRHTHGDLPGLGCRSGPLTLLLMRGTSESPKLRGAPSSPELWGEVAGRPMWTGTGCVLRKQSL